MSRVQVNTIFFPYWVMVKIFDSFTPINNTVIFSILNQFVGSTQQNSNTGHDSLFFFSEGWIYTWCFINKILYRFKILIM